MQSSLLNSEAATCQLPVDRCRLAPACLHCKHPHTPAIQDINRTSLRNFKFWVEHPTQGLSTSCWFSQFGQSTDKSVELDSRLQPHTHQPSMIHMRSFFRITSKGIYLQYLPGRTSQVFPGMLFMFELASALYDVTTQVAPGTNCKPPICRPIMQIEDFDWHKDWFLTFMVTTKEEKSRDGDLD